MGTLSRPQTWDVVHFRNQVRDLLAQSNSVVLDVQFLHNLFWRARNPQTVRALLDEYPAPTQEQLQLLVRTEELLPRKSDNA